MLCVILENRTGEDQQLWSRTELSLIYSSAIKGYVHVSIFIDFTKLISIEFVSMTLSIFPYFAKLTGIKSYLIVILIRVFLRETDNNNIRGILAICHFFHCKLSIYILFPYFCHLFLLLFIIINFFYMAVNPLFFLSAY